MSEPGKRITEAQFRTAHEKHGRDIEALREELQCSRATAYRWLERCAPLANREAPTPSQADLSMYIPKPEEGRIRREIDREIEDASDTGVPVSLVGETGTGKTTIVKEIAAALEIPFLLVPCDSGLDFNELLCSLHLVNGNTVSHEGPLVTFMQRPSVILLDEVNALDPGKFVLLFQLLDLGTIFVKEANKTYTKHPEARLFLAANPPTASYSVSQVSAALMNKVFCIDVPPFTESEVRQLLGKRYPDLSEKLSGQIVRFYLEVRRLCSEGNLRCQYSIRNIHYFVLRYRKSRNALQAMKSSFLDGILMTDDREAQAACSKLALTIFGKLPL